MYAIAPTDIDWFVYLRDNPTTQINFWTPTPWNIRQLKVGDSFFFLLKSPYRKIGGYGSFSYYDNLTARESWDKFGTGNGVTSFEELVTRCGKYAEKNSSTYTTSFNPTIGCIVLNNPIFLDEEDFFTPESQGVTFPNQVVKVKYFDGDGFDHIDQNLTSGRDFELISQDKIYKQVKTKHRKGQSQFRDQVLKAYGYKCAVTGETCQDVLQAAHIHPYVSVESNHIQNGICLRTDIHTLFDAGLITIESDYTVKVSPFLKSPAYNSLSGKRIELPTPIDQRPSPTALKFHRDNVFRQDGDNKG